MTFPPDGAEPGFTAEAVLGDEVNFSLRTTSPALAKRRQALASEALDRFLEGLSAPPEPLTKKEREAIAGVAYRNLVGQFEDDPGEIAAGADIGWEEFSSRLEDGLRHFNPHGDGIADPLYNPKLGLAVLEPHLELDKLLHSLGIHSLAPGDRAALAEDVAVALRDACSTLLRRVRRDFGKDSRVERFPADLRP